MEKTDQCGGVFKFCFCYGREGDGVDYVSSPLYVVLYMQNKKRLLSLYKKLPPPPHTHTHTVTSDDEFTEVGDSGTAR